MNIIFKKFKHMKFLFKFIGLSILCFIGFILVEYVFPEIDAQKSIALSFAIQCFAVYIIGMIKLFDINEK